MAGRELLRAEAKKVYKEQTKSIPKKNRIPFAQFYKKFKEIKKNQQQQHNNEAPVVTQDVGAAEDFDFENLINVNEISDEELESEPVTEVQEEK